MRRSVRTPGSGGVVPRVMLWAGMRCPDGTRVGGTKGLWGERASTEPRGPGAWSERACWAGRAGALRAQGEL
jgi:hypothetical protein